MKIKTLAAVSTIENTGLKKLEASLIKFGYDYKILQNPSIQWNWGGLGDVYNWCLSEEAQTYTHFLFTDGFDTVALSPLEEIKIADKIIYSGEKACFPRSDWADRHAESTKWKYLNHGQLFAPISLYLELYKDCFELPLTCQEWAMEKYLNGDDRLIIDTNCDIFQSMAFDYEGDIVADGDRILNTITGTRAIFAHGNGRTNIDWIYKLVE
jgi:hypothetical protein